MTKVLYLLVDTTEYELPLGVYDTLKEVSLSLGVSRETLKTAIRRHGCYKTKKTTLHRVKIDIDNEQEK